MLYPFFLHHLQPIHMFKETAASLRRIFQDFAADGCQVRTKIPVTNI